MLSTTTLSAGQVFTYNLPNVPNRAYTITTGKRAYVYHVSSYAANEFGMGILPTINPCNGSKRIDFCRTTSSSNDQAVVMIPTAGLASLTFRGAPYTTYGTVVDNLTIAGVAHSIVSFPNGSIATAGTVNTVTSNGVRFNLVQPCLLPIFVVVHFLSATMTQTEFIALATSRYEQIQALNQLDSFYDYEKDFDQLWTELGRDVLEKNLGDLPNDPQKKTPCAPATEL